MGVPVATYTQRRAGYFNVREYGAKGDGSTDDTTAIEAAFAAAMALTPRPGVLYFPAGNFLYNGTGLTASGNPIAIDGVTANHARVTLGATSSLLVLTTASNRIEMRGMSVVNGVSAIRSTYTGSESAAYTRIITDNVFDSQTGGAITNNASDSAWWNIQRNRFKGASAATSIGIALGGLSNGSNIRDNSFTGLFRYNIKLTSAGPDTHVEDNDFVHAAGSISNERARIWIVPKSSSTSASGMKVTGNKFGGENLATGDYHILIADGTVAENGTTNLRDNIYADLTNASTGFVLGCNVQLNNLVNAGSGAGIVTAPVYSMTPNVRAWQISDNALIGTPYAYILQFGAAVTLVPDAFTQNNIAKGNLSEVSGINTVFPTQASNLKGMLRLVDFTDQLNGMEMSPLSTPGGGSFSEFTNLLTTQAASFTKAGSVTNIGAVTDSVGAADAFEYAYTVGASDLIFGSISSATLATVIGEPVWVEFDLKQGTTTPLTQVTAVLRYGGSTTHWKRLCLVQTGWRRYRFLFIPRQASANLQFQIISNTTAGQVQIGRVSIYQAQEPVSFGPIKLRSPNGTMYTVTVSDAGALVVA